MFGLFHSENKNGNGEKTHAIGNEIAIKVL